MRFLPILLCAACSTVLPALEFRFDDCGNHCDRYAVEFTNLMPTPVTPVIEDHPYTEGVIAAATEHLIAWLDAIRGVEKPLVVAIAEEAPKPKPIDNLGRASMAAYLQSMRGLSSYEYEPVDAKFTGSPDEIILADPEKE